MLALEGVAAAYGMSQVLSGIALSVGAGEAVALLGRNGVGKTTLLRTIVGLHPASAGRITFRDAAIAGLPAHRRARLGIGYVPQGRGIFPQLTVGENLAVGSSALDGRKPHAAADVAPLYDLFPVLARLRDRKGGVLSGGEQQQLALARALIGKPRLLLLDEPTEGIQPSIVSEIERVLGAVRRELGVALLLVEQHLDFAWSIADRYYVMQRGSVVKSGATATESAQTVAPLLSV
ncbi:MAG: urea ABC transporter ATP-binding subunit UrtE [Vulcanimicrobiaceae bacterium]